MDIEAAREWKYSPRKKLQGELKDEGTRFSLSLNFGKTRLDKNAPAPETIIGNSHNMQYYFRLQHVRSAGYSRALYTHGEYTTKEVVGYTLLQSRRPITRTTYKELQVEPQGNLVYVPGLSPRFNDGQMTLGTPYKHLTLHKAGDHEIALEVSYSSEASEGKVIVTQHDKIILKYNRVQRQNRMLTDLGRTRSLIMLTSFFNNDFNNVSMELIPPIPNRDRSNVVKLETKHYKNIQVESKNHPSPPNSWLFDVFLSRPLEISDSYFDLLDNTDIQTSINFYLAMYLPAKQNSVIEYHFMYSVMLIESLYERLLVQPEDTNRRDSPKTCSKCKRSFCSNCVPAQHTPLEVKLRMVVEQYIKGTQSAKYFEKVDYRRAGATRNHYAHIKISGTSELLSIHDMITAAAKFEYLFIYILLNTIGYTNEELDKILPDLDSFYLVRDR